MENGKQVEMFFTQEQGKDPIQKAQEYLDNPNRLDIYQRYLKEYGNRRTGARGICEVINREVGFPMTFWDSAKPDIINYRNIRQIEEYVQQGTVEKAA